MRGLAVPSGLLFSKRDIYHFVEDQQGRLKAAYESLPDDDALNSDKTQALKEKFAVAVPTLLRDKIEYESKEKQVTANEFLGRNMLGLPGQALRDIVEYVFHVPFEGDAFVFDIAPSAFNGTVAAGEVVGQEVLIRFQINNPNINPEALLEEELRKIDWRLNNLRGSTEHLTQQLNITLANCIAARKRSIENRAKMAAAPIRFAKRESTPPSAAEVRNVLAVPSGAPAQTEKAQKWDIFMSHASPDKPYVRELVAELRKAEITVWFDEDSIAWGESLRPAINKGLINSSYAIVVLSKPFLAERKWTEHELNGLFAREKIGRFIILPIWHAIEHEDLVNYDPALSDRLAKVSATDGIPDIVRSALQALGRDSVDITVAPEIKQNLAQARERGSEARELVAYAWYEQKGPDAEREQIYVRKSDFIRGGFVLINGDQEHDGTQDDVAGIFFTADKHLKAKGFVRMQFSNPSNIPAFEI
jgi:hypothetical protein